MTEYQTCNEGACGSCDCGSEGCGCGSEKVDFYDLMESKLMGMAFVAHKSVLFEKISKRIEERQGEKLDKIAELVVESSMDRLKDGQEAAKRRAELREKIKEVFEE